MSYPDRWHPKGLIEHLDNQAAYVPDWQTRGLMEMLVERLRYHHPAGPDGKHGDHHTDTCGCDDTERRPACEVFAWIGQAFTSCDTCGKPYWEHSYEYAGDSPFGDGRRPITDEKRAAVRRKWEGYR
jgi:hypothetical protein